MPTLTWAVWRVGQFARRLLPPALLDWRFFRRLGRCVHRHIARSQLRGQSHSSWFMRNPPQLEALRDVLGSWPPGARLRVASAGSSTGAELYSTVSFLRSARSDPHVVGLGIDISEGVVAAAREGVYRRARPASSRGLFAPGPPEMSPDPAGCHEACWSALLTSTARGEMS